MTLYRSYELRDDIDDVIAVAKEFNYPKAAKLLTDLRDQNKLADLIDWIEKNLTFSNPGHNIGNFFYFLNQNEQTFRFKFLGENT